MASVMVSLPLQLLCQLIGSSPTSNESICGPNVNHTSLYIQPGTLPSGYVAYPDIGVALKAHDQRVSWMVARKECELEGGNLAVIDSYTKYEYAVRQRQSTGFTHVGILAIYDDNVWVSVVTNLPVLSIPWAQNYPSGSSDCVMVAQEQGGLGNFQCTTLGDYVCEIPIPKSQVIQGSRLTSQISVN